MLSHLSSSNNFLKWQSISHLGSWGLGDAWSLGIPCWPTYAKPSHFKSTRNFLFSFLCYAFGSSSATWVCTAKHCPCDFTYCLFYSSDQARDSITSYLTGEPGKIEANGNHTAEVIPEAKAKPYFPESQNDIGKQSIKENLKPKTHGCGRTEEPVSPLTAYQKSLEETSKLVIEDAPKPCVPVRSEERRVGKECRL